MNTTKGKRPALGFSALFLAVILTLLPARVGAQCTQWDVSGEWEMSQGPTVIYLNLNQRGSRVTGTARYQGLKGVVVRGSVAGRMNADRFDGEIHWSDNKTGVYTGYVKAVDGRFGGRTYNKAAPTETAYWTINATIKCTETASEPKVSSSAPPITKLKIKPAPTPSSASAPPTTKPVTSTGGPRISASPKAPILSAGQQRTETTVGWDGGRDHPYAELWVKVDDADEKFVVELGKGSYLATVERGKTYLFILEDAGQQLATVTVKAQ